MGLLGLVFSLLLVLEVGAQEGETHGRADNPGMFYGPKVIIPREFWPTPFQPPRKSYGEGNYTDAEILYPNQRQYIELGGGKSTPSGAWVRVNLWGVVFDTPDQAQAYVEQWATNLSSGANIESRNRIPGADASAIIRTHDTENDTDFLAACCLGRAFFRIDIDGNTVHFDGAEDSVPPPADSQLLGYFKPWANACFRLARQNGWDQPVDGKRSSNSTPLPTNVTPGALDQATVDPVNPAGLSTIAVTGFASLAVSGLTALGAGLMMLGTGVSPREVIDGVRELFTGTSDAPQSEVPPPLIDDDFERWKRDYESRGWRYTERDGVAEFEPVEGATNESGWTYSEGSGSFEPPEDQRREPEMPPADANYREEVRLLQEDLERQADFLDRERERLRHYEQAGLKELLPGANERIREYEKLAELNRAELERLNENLPTHTIEDNRDLKADAGERLRSRDLIHDLNEGDKRIEAGDAMLEDTQQEIDQIEEEITSLENKLFLTPELSALDDMFLKSQKQLIEDGYRVLNPAYDAPWLPVQQSLDSLAFVESCLGEIFVPGYKAIRCDGFAEIGQKNVEAYVKGFYGDRADEVIFDKVYLDVVRDDSFGGKVSQMFDAVRPKNHVANRVILPDGRRYILDYWEGNRSGRTSMVTEEVWVARWKERTGEDLKYIGSNNRYVRKDQTELMNQVESLKKNKGKSLEEALEEFRRNREEAIGSGKGTPEIKERKLKQMKTLIKSYRRSGRFYSEGLENYDL